MVSSYDSQRANGVVSSVVYSESESVSTAKLCHHHTQMERLQSILDDKDTLLEKQKNIFARALASAGMGVWQCTLPDNDLEWTDVVYDIFDLPRGSKLDRVKIVDCYSPVSLEKLETLRNQAIADGSGFSMDAEITTNKGNRRWIRITATVDSGASAAVRIFGIKQDITEEKLMLDRMCYLATHDVMTGLANRSKFQTKLAEFSGSGNSQINEIALLLIDLDGFKTLNDTFGHSFGDDCLKEASKRLKRILGQSSLIARIGGDEFAVFTDRRQETRDVSEIGQAIVSELQRKVSVGGVEVTIGGSVGIAFANGSSPEDFFKRADTALYAAKTAGRNQFKIFEEGVDLAQRRPRSAA